MKTITIPECEYERIISRLRHIDTLESNLEILKQQNAQYQEEIAHLISIIKLSYKKIYGSSSEKTTCKDQLLLFDEPEGVKAAEPAPFPDNDDASRRKTRKGTRNEQSLQKAIDSLPVSRRCDCELKESERVCPLCGDIMQHSGSEMRRFIEFLPATASIVEERLFIYKCRNCEKHAYQII